jgi:hypothetical protein
MSRRVIGKGSGPRLAAWPLGLALLATACGPETGGAQDWRSVTSFRQLGSESRLDVEVRYGAGRLVVEPGARGELYRVGIRYDSDNFEPITEYRSGRLRVGVEGGSRSIRIRNREAGDLKLSLSPDVPIDLGLTFGAVEANIELGGLHVSRVKVETGASDSRMRFSRPNRMECDRLDLSMGAAAFRLEGLANANCARIKADGGVGDMNLDFTGDWRRDLTAEINMALGSVTLAVPDDVGVVVRRSTFLTSFNGPGFTRDGRDHYSDNWDRAERKLTVELQGAFGSVTVRRVAATSS